MSSLVRLAVCVVLLTTAVAPARGYAQKPPPAASQGGETATLDPVEVDPRREARRALRWWRSQGLSVLAGPSVSIGPVYHTGGLANIDGSGRTENLAGFRYEEHGGMTAGLLLGAAAMVGSVAAAGMPSSVEYGPTSTSTAYHNDGSRTVTTSRTVTATYDDPAGRQQLLDNAPAAVGAGAMIQSQSLLVEFFLRDLVGERGDGYGYRMRMMFPVVRRDHLWLEMGVGFQSIITLDSDTALARKSVVRGTPIFMHIPFGWAYLTLGVDVNWSSLLFDNDRPPEAIMIDGESYAMTQRRRWPMTAAITTNLWRLQVRAEVESDGIDAVGFRLGAGVRF